ncbi:MAG: hypothetical protein KAW19_02645, partial [Candidatus Aminicenantes bacterium]|nr:hypothetical protein [Candidatus Aminicenantes bacterium]
QFDHIVSLLNLKLLFSIKLMDCNHFFLLPRREGIVRCNKSLFFSLFLGGLFFCSLLFILVLLIIFSNFSFPL